MFASIEKTLSNIVTPGKKQAVADFEQWNSELDAERLLDDFTQRLKHGAPVYFSRKRCYQLDEIDALNRTFEKYSNGKGDLDEEGLKRFLLEHTNPKEERDITANANILRRYLIGAGNWPFLVEDASQSILKLDTLERAIAVATDRIDKLFDGELLGTQPLMSKMDSTRRKGILFRSIARKRRLDSSEIDTDNSSANVWKEREDILDVVVASQPTFPQKFYISSRESFVAVAERLDPKQAYEFSMTVKEFAQLIGLLCSTQEHGDLKKFTADSTQSGNPPEITTSVSGQVSKILAQAEISQTQIIGIEDFMRVMSMSPQLFNGLSSLLNGFVTSGMS